MGLFFIKGILIGLLFGVPAGAVGAMTAQRTLNYGIKAGLLTGLGSSVADCFYACIGAFGLTLISDFLLSCQSIINLAGGCLILGMGIRMLMMKNNTQKNTPDSTVGIRMFISSFAVGITNPAAILTFLFAFSWFGINGQTGLAEGVGLVCGVFIGTYIWWGTLSGAAAVYKKKSKKNYLSIINRIFGIILLLFGAVVMLSACGNRADKNHPASSSLEKDTKSVETGETFAEADGTHMQKMTVETDGQKFKASLYDNETVRSLQNRLPMTVEMEELNGNEKFYYLDEGLPVNSENVGNIKAGDIMLFGSDCLVLFFKDFSTSYSYTKIGHIEEEEAFVNALSGGTVEVHFEAGE